MSGKKSALGYLGVLKIFTHQLGLPPIKIAISEARYQNTEKCYGIQWYIMDVYTSYTVGITKKTQLLSHNPHRDFRNSIFQRNWGKYGPNRSQLLLESAEKTIRDTIMIFFYSVSYHGLFNPYPISAP